MFNCSIQVFFFAETGPAQAPTEEDNGLYRFEWLVVFEFIEGRLKRYGKCPLK